MRIRKKVVLTQHSKDRIKERSQINEAEKEKIIKFAYINGYTPKKFKGPFKQYLCSKYRSGIRVVAYLGYIFIFKAYSEKLITMYPIPEKYMEEFNDYVERRKNNGKKQSVQSSQIKTKE